MSVPAEVLGVVSDCLSELLGPVLVNVNAPETKLDRIILSPAHDLAVIDKSQHFVSSLMRHTVQDGICHELVVVFLHHTHCTE